MDPVNIDYNIGGNYSASLTQMVQQSEQAAQSHGSLIGQIARLDNAIVSLMTRTTALSGANKTATATAAAYQQSMSNIAASAKVAGQDMGRLEQTTLSLARSMPSGLGQAVRIVETLQQSGVKAESSIESLGKSWAKLGEANGLDPAALGSAMLNLNRAFGNSEKTFSGFSDVLTHTTKTFGASADSALAYSKALAPVAAAAGMSESAVIGLGTAAARVGEDGTASATAFNKVLLDMQRAVRDGGPDLLKYSQLLNMSQQSLTTLFKSDPSEVIVRFTEAIKKGGPDAQRQLEALGMDSVRTIRAIQAMSSQGNLRQIIGEATGSFNNGATAAGADEALNNVNSQAAMLGETLQQTVAAAGKPFLGFLTEVVRLANMAAEAVRKLVDNPLTQGIGKIASIGSFAGSAGFQALSALSTVALGQRLFNFGRRTLPAVAGMARGQAEELQMAAMMARRGEPLPEDASRLERGMYAYGQNSPQGPKYPVQKAMYAVGDRPTVRGIFSAVGRGGAQGAEFIGRAVAQDFATADANGAGMGARFTGPLGGIRNYGYMTDAAGKETISIGSRLGRTAALLPVESAAYVGRNVGRGSRYLFNKALGRSTAQAVEAEETAAMAPPVGPVLMGPPRGVPAGAPAPTGPALPPPSNPVASPVPRGGIGGGMLGSIGPMLAITAATVVAEKLYSQKQEDDQKRAGATTDAVKDIYGQFNEFAAASGYAAREVRSLGDTVANATKRIADQNTTMEQAFKLNAAELNDSTSPTYKRAFNPDTTDTNILAVQGRLLLGENATPSQISRFATDVNNAQPGQGQSVLDRMKGLQKASIGDLYKASESSLSQTPWWGGVSGFFQRSPNALAFGPTAPLKLLGNFLGTGTTAQGEVTQRGLTTAVGDYQTNVTSKYGDNAATAAKLSGESQAYEAARKLNDPVARQRALESVAADMGFDRVGFLQEAADKNLDFAGMMDLGNQRRTGGGRGQQAPENYGAWDEYNSFRQSDIGKNFNLNKPNYQPFASTAEIQRNISEVAPGFADVMFGEQNSIRTGRPMTADQKAYNAFTKDNTSGAAMEKAAGALDKAAAALTTNGRMNYGLAANQLKNIIAYSTPEADQSKAAQSKLMSLSVRAPFEQMGMTASERTAQSASIISDIQRLSPTSDIQEQQRRVQGISDASGAYMDELQQMKQFTLAAQQLDIQSARQKDDFYNKETGARARAEKDFQDQQKYSTDQFNRSMDRADTEHKLQLKRADRDFKTQTDRANEDHTTQVDRAYRDQRIQETRAIEDHNTQKIRAQRDFNKQMRRMIEDAAKSLYDPYKRIQAQQVWDARSLLQNLKEQNEAIKKQADELNEAKALGLSQAAISQLDLSNPQNAQQLAKLMAQFRQDPNLVAQYNQAAATRTDASGDLVSQSDTYARAAEDFKTSMNDAEIDFQKSMARSRADFKKGLADNELDFQRSMKRARADYLKGLSDNEHDFKVQMGYARADFKTQMTYAETQHTKSMTRMEQDLTKSLTRAEQDLLTFAKDINEGPAGIIAAFNKAWGNLPAGVKTGASAGLKAMVQDAKGALQGHLNDLFKGVGITLTVGTTTVNSGDAKDSGSYGRRPSGGTGSGDAKDRGRSIGGLVMGSGSETSDSIPMMLSNNEYVIKASMVHRWGRDFFDQLNSGVMPSETGGDQGRAGASIKDELMDLQRKLDEAESKANRAKLDTEKDKATIKLLQDQLKKAQGAKTGKPAMSAHEAHLAHLAHLAGQAPTPAPAAAARTTAAPASSNSAAAQMQMLEKEFHALMASFAKDGGKGMMAAVRHLSADTAKNARVALHSTVINNKYSYDNRTQFTGPVTVKANDPAKMAEELKKQIAHSRLVSPGRAGLPTSV